MAGRRENGAERGAVAVEFALVLVPLLLLVFGIIDFGRFYNEQITLTSLARQGARIASLSPASPDPTSSIQQQLINSAPSWLELTSAQITVQRCPSSPSGSSTASATVTITANYTYTIAQLAK
ncbi:MAG TPA: TadE family protein, partial [Jatrophihabitantaceae bacterium]|nr:TadE family protein [Jatrophihabitantaceae bacterium]